MSIGRHNADESLRLLVEAGAALAEARTVDDVAAEVVRAAVPCLAEGAAVFLAGPDGRLACAAARHADPALEPLVRRLASDLRGEAAARLDELARRGEPRLFSRLNGLEVASTGATPEQVDLLRRLAPRSAVVAPLLARGESLGLLCLFSPDAGRFDEDDLALAADLARRAGPAAALARAAAPPQDDLPDDAFRILADSIPQLAWMAHADGHIFWYNKRWYEYTGTTLEDMKGWGWQAVHDPEALPGVLARWGESIRTGEPFEMVFPLRGADGVFRPFLTRIAPVLDARGRVVRWFGTNTDIAEREQIEQRLRVRNERLNLLWEAAGVLLATEDPDAMLGGLFAKVADHLGVDASFNFMVDEAGEALRLRYCTGIPDDVAARITRLEFGQAVCGRVALSRRPIIAERIQESDAPMVQLVKGLGIRAYACNPLIADGELLGTLSLASRTRDSFDEDELGFIATITHYVTIAYQRLRFIERLRETDRRKDEFLAMLAHELRNPLASVRNAVHLLRLKGSNGPDEVWAREAIDRQVNNLVRLIDDLLDVSRITRGKITLRRERVRLRAVLENSAEAARPLIDAKGHRLDLEFTPPDDDLQVEGDPTRLEQIFVNLLSNAARYTEPGGAISVRATRLGDSAVVAVRDDGIGIPAGMLRRIFDMFEQADGSHDRSAGGLGIGLTLARSLAEMHGGALTASSDGPGRGSEFTVMLPLAPPAEAPGPAPAESPPEPTAQRSTSPPKRVLIVDDVVDAARGLAEILDHCGFEVRAVHDGPSALVLAPVFRPEVVLLDIGLPGMNGYEVARALRAQPGGESLRMFAVTGYGQARDLERSRAAGFEHHVVKPVDFERLLALLAAPAATA